MSRVIPNWPLITLLLQVVILAYLVYAFQRIAHNQLELAAYLKERLGKGE